MAQALSLVPQSLSSLFSYSFRYSTSEHTILILNYRFIRFSKLVLMNIHKYCKEFLIFGSYK